MIASIALAVALSGMIQHPLSTQNFLEAAAGSLLVCITFTVYAFYKRQTGSTQVMAPHALHTSCLFLYS